MESYRQRMPGASLTILYQISITFLGHKSDKSVALNRVCDSGCIGRSLNRRVSKTAEFSCQVRPKMPGENGQSFLPHTNDQQMV